MLSARGSFMVIVVLASAFLRLLPHPPNMTPVIGMALFAGAALADKRLAIITPLLALLASDAVLGFYPHMEIVYAAVVLVTSIGFLGKDASALRIGCLALSGSLLFYLVTNAGVWALDGLYPITLTGLGTCYLMALPFLGNQLLGDALTVALLFGGLRMLERRFPIDAGSPTYFRQA